LKITDYCDRINHIIDDYHHRASIRNGFGFEAPEGGIPCSDRFIPCSYKEDSLFRSIRELRAKKLELLCDLASTIAQIVEIQKIPCYFPCSQGIANFRDGDPVCTDRLIGFDIRKHRD